MNSTPANEIAPEALAPDLQATVLLRAVARECRDGRHLLEFRSRRETGGMDSAFFDTKEIEKAAEYAVEVGAKTDTFVGMGLRNRRSGSGVAVDEVHLLWADLDKDDALDALAAYEPSPGFVVRSGGRTERGRPKIHAYWPLRRPVPVKLVKPMLKRLAAALSADPACVDAARIMRVPGTFNFKSDPPAPVELELP